MIVCDRCLEKKSFVTRTYFTKQDDPKQKKKFRTMLSVEMILCEDCIREWLEKFGGLKFRFLEEGNIEPKGGVIANETN